jgi:hypothetical protein
VAQSDNPATRYAQYLPHDEPGDTSNQEHGHLVPRPKGTALPPRISSPSLFWGEVRGILSSLAREWLRIAIGFLIVNGPEPALRSLNKLMCVNGGERRKVVSALSGSKKRHAKCAKPTPSQNRGSNLKFLQHLVRCRSGYIHTGSTLERNQPPPADPRPPLPLLLSSKRQARYDTDGALKRDVLPLAREFFRPCVAPHPRRIA